MFGPAPVRYEEVDDDLRLFIGVRLSPSNRETDNGRCGQQTAAPDGPLARGDR
ncbi:hypothetical protein ACFQMM_04480 [Saliphagus sp. GCM10025308]